MAARYGCSGVIISGNLSVSQPNEAVSDLSRHNEGLIIQSEAERLQGQAKEETKREKNRRKLQTIFNSIVAVSGAVTVAVLVYQAYVMQSSLTVARNSADAATRGAVAAGRAADSAKQSADISEKTMRLDQRAWINASISQAPLIDGQPIKMPLKLVNTGKTPAVNVDGVIVVNLLSQNEQPDFAYRTGHPRLRFEGGTFLPGIPSDYLLPVLPKHLALEKPLNPILCTPEIRQNIENGSAYIVVHGKVTYDDIFGISHWLTFCTYSHNVPGLPTQPTASTCGKYNDVDRN